MLTDTHFHALDLEGLDPDWRAAYETRGVLGVASCHSLKEYEHAEALRRSGLPLLVSFGVHPQEALPDELPAIERLAAEGKLDAIGECGFDLFAPEYAASLDAQRSLFAAQLSIGRRFGLPLVVHARKAMGELFSFAAGLAGLPAVIFHAWPGSPEEARAFLRKGINAFFSMGAQAINGRRLSARSIRELPLERILVESDAPYQQPRGDRETDFCRIEDLASIYRGLAEIRGMAWDELATSTERNLTAIMGGNSR